MQPAVAKYGERQPPGHRYFKSQYSMRVIKKQACINKANSYIIF